MRALDIIAKKRDGLELDSGEIAFLVNSYVKGEVPDYQMSAWLMAVCIQGMNFRETADLTKVMLDSGLRLDFSHREGPFVDKHSTGGVGDKVSLILAPLAAACGIKVPMMSGRSLGHTGGTLDKLDSIPGYQTRLDARTFEDTMFACGFAMTGQTKDIAPADRLMYSLRDASATVESIPLITASILSKKCAEGSQSLVFDVKFGSGAFMKTFESARELAVSLVGTAEHMGLRARALLTRMDFPLGMAVGNFFEVEESFLCLQKDGAGLWAREGRGRQARYTGSSANLMELVLRQCAQMLLLGGLESDEDSAVERAFTELSNGHALDLFLKNIRLQGGDAQQMRAGFGNRRAGCSDWIYAPERGYLHAWDAMVFGRAGLEIGVGRNRTEDPVLYDTGMFLHAVQGQRVEKDQKLCQVFASTKPGLEKALAMLREGLKISPEPIPVPDMIREVI